MADIDSNLPARDASDGADGAVAPPYTQQVGGIDGSGNLQSISVNTSGAINVNNISGTVTLPTGAATETTLSAVSGKLPATLGQKTMANSLAVAIASDQSAIPASQSGTWNINNVSGTVSLPTGAATSALQTTGNSSLSTIAGTLTLSPGSTTSGQSGSLTMGAVTTASPSYTTGQTNFLSLTTAGALRVDASATIQPVSQSGTWNINNVSGTVSLPTGASTSANQTNGSQKTQIVDGAGSVIESYNNQLAVEDIIDTAVSSGTISVTTSQTAARVGGSNLTSRKSVWITPTNGTIYWGATGLTTSTGTPIFKNQTVQISVSANVTVFLIASVTTDVRIVEGS